MIEPQDGSGRRLNLHRGARSGIGGIGGCCCCTLALEYPPLEERVDRDADQQDDQGVAGQRGLEAEDPLVEVT